jgi:hypothetical protein
LVELGLAADSVPDATSPPAVEPPPGASVPSAKLAPAYAEPSIYRQAARPLIGYPWEKHGHDAFEALNTKQPKRLIEKLRWLANQFSAGGIPTSLRKLITDILQDFVRRELKAWGVPAEHLD